MEKKVLIYEAMQGHGECLSSYYAFFSELGYDVDFVIMDTVAKEKPLWMLEDAKIYPIQHKSSANFTSMRQHFEEIKNKVKDVFSYDLYFIGSFTQNSYNFVKFLLDNGVKKDKILHQNHLNYETYLIKSNKDIALGQNGFTLGMSDHDKFPQLSPSINISKENHNPLDKNFSKKEKLSIFVGGLSHIHFKNFELFVKAVDELNKEGYNIKVNVTGIREQGSYILPKSNNVKYLGRINFEDMAKQYCINDFLFVLFDEKALMCQIDHNTFLDGRVSGSRNMTIMYKIPLVVQKAFQLSWGLDDTNSISFEGHDYKKVLLDLYKTNKTKYNKIMESLKEKEKEEFELCLENLKNKIESLKINKYDNKTNIKTTPTYQTRPTQIKKKRDFIHF